jgi:hypothetical protein
MCEVTTASGTSGHGMLGANSNPESCSLFARKSNEVEILRPANGIEEHCGGYIGLDATKCDIEVRGPMESVFAVAKVEVYNTWEYCGPRTQRESHC